ncbi:phenylacetate--CoA ligase family protein [Desulfoferrobacter suflitae]|uniref:phenylacetate--CoA ligase family protein n=1 Tax=Desulfoferrobacter suflitae TaxID=2865782 RepID=UPI002164A567|nr:AMP-binding protein [Desulfoferrobacter suflitae]MCK8603836.1 AMP-binding protein [Desulfoferrobacter suflitae]
MPLNPIDTLSRKDIRQLQLERLQTTLNRAYFNVDFYRHRMDSLELLPEDVATFEDLRRFPFTTRRDLADHYPYGLFAVPLRSIVRLKVSSPMLRDRGHPIVVGFTRHDVGMWQALMMRLYEQLEVTDRDIVQVAFNFALFPGALTFNQAAESIGATLAPSATISATLQLQIMQDFRSTVLATTAAFALHLAETMKRQQLEPANLHLKIVLIGPDPLAEETRTHLERAFGAPVYGLYGVSEMVEPGIAGECPAKNGLHWAEDQFLAEIIDPATGEAVRQGQEGELVITTLTAEGYPIVRYRTGDVTVWHESPCPCGRSLARISPIARRTDNRLSVRGIPLYPEQLEAMLASIDPAIDDLRLVVHTRHGIGERLEILLARQPDREFLQGGRAHYQEFLRSHVRRALGLGVRIQLVERDRLPREGLIRKTIFKRADTPYDQRR